jgi:hypothetical protein
MFNPSREEVRRFFCTAWARHRDGTPVQPIEDLAIGWMLRHPEYHALLEAPEAALEQDFPVEAGRENPFLHLAMHLTLEEQERADQPKGIAAAMQALRLRSGDAHRAAHEAMECLGEILWRTQRASLPPDMAVINRSYLECLQRRG